MGVPAWYYRHFAAQLAEAGLAVVVVDLRGTGAVGLPYWRCYPVRRRLGVLLMTQTLAVTSAVLRVWPGWGFGGRQARGVIRDWAFTARTGAYPRFGNVAIDAALAQVTTPVLAIDVSNDQYTPAPTVDRLAGKLVAAKVTREHYAAAGIDHFKWARSAPALAERIATWPNA